MARTRAGAWQQWLLCAWLATATLPAAAGAGWTEDDLWAAEMKLDELRDAVADQVEATREVCAWACACCVHVHVHVCACARTPACCDVHRSAAPRGCGLARCGPARLVASARAA